MMRKKFCLIIVMMFFILPQSMAQDSKFKAIFMYNFTKYLEWPSNKKTGDFVIGVYGNSPIINELNIIAQKKKVGNQPIVIKKISNLGEASGCNIFYVPESKSISEQEVKANCGGKGTVVITNKPGLAKEFAGINYVMINGKQNFEINLNNIETQGVKVNSVLLSLGISVQ